MPVNEEPPVRRRPAVKRSTPADRPKPREQIRRCDATAVRRRPTGLSRGRPLPRAARLQPGEDRSAHSPSRLPRL